MTFYHNRLPTSIVTRQRKIYERLLLIRLMRPVLTKNLVPADQFDFRPGISTAHYILTELTASVHETKWTTLAVFLDISMAYDSSRHNQVLGELSKLLASFQALWLFRVKVVRAYLE